MRRFGWLLALLVIGATGGFIAALLRPRDRADYRSNYLPPAA
ncbi:MAG: hypothetical protein NTZ03_01830 [Actinobacteria bacterium]|nr:hypothetical protein [Actinomycetota bacterium]